MKSGYPSRDFERFEEEKDVNDNGQNHNNPPQQSGQIFSIDDGIKDADEKYQQSVLDNSLIAKLTTSVGVLTARRDDLKYQLSDVENQLANQVEALQAAKYPLSSPRGKTDEYYTGRSFDFAKQTSSRGSPAFEQNEQGLSVRDMDDLDTIGPLTSSFDQQAAVTGRGRWESGTSEITDTFSINNGDVGGRASSPHSQSGKSSHGIGKLFGTSSHNSFNGSEFNGERAFSSSQTRPKSRTFSFTVEGMTEAEVHNEVLKTTSKRDRSFEESIDNKLITVRRKPQLLEEPHEETFFELFYDLLIVAAFSKLSYLKYDMTLNGILTVAAIFSNFWSCWSLMNCYVTMLHTEDMVHRFYYVGHITASFVMAITVDHPDHSFFHYSSMAQYHAGASVICRSLTLCMWAYAYHNDLESTKDEQSLFLYSQKHLRKQIGVHFFSILASMFIFSITLVIPWIFEDAFKDSWYIAILWIIAVFIEQFGTSLGAVFMKLPFPAIYAGERMQAWLMLCFGESVVGLLIEPIFYDSSQFGTLIAAFFMILAVCTTWFDIVNADQFLHLFMVRKEKYKAFFYMNFQLPFSLSIFLGGIGLKNILFVSNAIFELEASEGCAGNSGSSSSSSLAGGGGSEFSVLELDDLVFSSFEMLTFSFTAVMVASILIGYGMPIELPFWEVHMSRIGAVCCSTMTILIPYNLKSLATPCLLDNVYDDAIGTDASGYRQGLSLLQGLVTISIIFIFSFCVALGSLDPNREETYTKLEVEAHYLLAKKVLTKRAETRKNVFTLFAETISNNIPDVFTDNVVTNTVFARSRSFVGENENDDDDVEGGEKGGGGRRRGSLNKLLFGNKIKKKKKKKVKKERSPSPPLSRKRNYGGTNQKIFIHQEPGDSVTATREKFIIRGDKITIPVNVGHAGQETAASRNRQISLETGAVEEQIKLVKNSRQNASKTLTNAKAEWEARDKVTKVQDIGNLNKETEASKNRKGAKASVENVGSSEMAARSNRAGRRESSQMMTDAKVQWEKRRAKQQKEALLTSNGGSSSAELRQVSGGRDQDNDGEMDDFKTTTTTTTTITDTSTQQKKYEKKSSMVSTDQGGVKGKGNRVKSPVRSDSRFSSERKTSSSTPVSSS